MNCLNLALLILDDTAEADEIQAVYAACCEDQKNKYSRDAMVIPSNLKALEKLPKWEQLVLERTADVPSPSLDAQLYAYLVTCGLQQDVYLMKKTDEQWGYQQADFFDYEIFNEGRIDPRPKQMT